MVATVHIAVFIGILTGNNYYSEFHDLFINELDYVVNHFNADKDVIAEGKMLLTNVDTFRNIMVHNDDPEEIRLKTASYNTEILCCSFLESLLRLQYQYTYKESEYINFGKITLGALLNPQNNKIRIFSDDHLSALAYFLINVGENRDIGLNYRNKLAHLFDVYKHGLSINQVCLLLYLLTDVLNTIFIRLVQKNHS